MPRILIAALTLAFVGACADGSQGTRKIPRVGEYDDVPTRGIADAGGDIGGGGADVGGGLDGFVEDKDAGPDEDAEVLDPDAEVEADMAVPDAAEIDPDAAELAPDAAEPDPDMAPPEPDMAPPEPDAAPPEPDMAPPNPDVPPGRIACTRGRGWSLLQVRWNGRSFWDDHWDAPCDSGININGCGAFDRCGPADGIAGCDTASVDQGTAMLLDGNDDFLLRYSVEGLRFSGATLYFTARGTRGNAEMEMWSPEWGGLIGPVDGQYQTYEVNWSDFVRQGDRFGTTAVRIRATRSHVGLANLEICLIP